MSVNSVRTLAASLSVLLFAACAQTPPEPAMIENTEEVVATVESINMETRMVTLRGPDGAKFSTQVSPEVRNLAQVKVGDKVVARYYEALAAELVHRGDKSGTTQAPVVDAGAARAAAGERPAGAIGAQSRQTVRVTAIDKKNNVVSFYGSDGLTRSVPVRTPQGQEFVSKLQVGDEVELTYTEAVAVSVEPSK